MSKKILNHNNYPYQVIDGRVYYLNSSGRQLDPRHFLLKKPLVPLLVYLTAKGANMENSTEWCDCAANIGDLEALQFLRAAGAPWDMDTCIAAAQKGHLEVLRWARAAGAPWDVDVCENAAFYGHIEILRWAHAAGAPWNENICAYTAWNGHLKVLEWLRTAGAPWDEDTCYNAARNGHFDVLKWAYLNGCPCKKIHEQEVQQKLLSDKDINWSLQCKEKWNSDNRKSFLFMIDQVVNKCRSVTGVLLHTCLSNLIVTYL